MPSESVASPVTLTSVPFEADAFLFVLVEAPSLTLTLSVVLAVRTVEGLTVVLAASVVVVEDACVSVVDDVVDDDSVVVAAAFV